MTVAGSIWLDGRLVDGAAPQLSVTDRGFQLGDGIFETARARRGVVIELEEHLGRLGESAEALAIRLPFDAAILAAGIHELLAAEGFVGPGEGEAPPGDAAIRITVSRGPIGQRGLLPPGLEAIEATVAIQAWAYAEPSAALLERGVRAIPSAIRRDPSSPLSGIKSISRADYVYAKLEASRAGADDALFLTIHGDLSEATSANLWVVQDGRLTTPPRSAAVLPGTTRTWLLEHAAELGLEPHEATLRPEDLLSGEEAMLSSSVAGIVPLTRYAGQPIGDGRPGPWSATLRGAREGWIDRVSRSESVQ